MLVMYSIFILYIFKFNLIEIEKSVCIVLWQNIKNNNGCESPAVLDSAVTRNTYPWLVLLVVRGLECSCAKSMRGAGWGAGADTSSRAGAGGTGDGGFTFTMPLHAVTGITVAERTITGDFGSSSVNKTSRYSTFILNKRQNRPDEAEKIHWLIEKQYLSNLVSDFLKILKYFIGHSLGPVSRYLSNPCQTRRRLQYVAVKYQDRIESKRLHEWPNETDVSVRVR